MKNKLFSRSAFLVAVITLIAGLGVGGTEMFLRVDARSVDAFHKVELSNKASALRYSIERKVNTTLHLSTGLIIYVVSNPDIQNAEFAQVAASLIAQAEGVLNIGLAKDNVISHIYPLEGNEAALGLDYLTTPSQRDTVLQAIRAKQTVIAGPVNLVQGGQGLVGRIPIFLQDSAESYWGVASVVIDFEQFKGFVLDYAKQLGLAVALKGRHATGLEGDVFIGSESMFLTGSTSSITTISLPVGSWVLAADYAVPPNNALRKTVIRTVGYFLTALIAALICLLLSTLNTQRRLSLHDSLTGLANRRLFDEQIKYAIARAKRNDSLMGIIYVDLNDFKSINDRYGHKAGDAVLIAVAQRVRASLRQTDFLARLGGDEFVVILEALSSQQDPLDVVATITAAINQPITLDDNHEVTVGASMSVVIYPDDGEDKDTLLRTADQRMYQSKPANMADQ